MRLISAVHVSAALSWSVHAAPIPPASDASATSEAEVLPISLAASASTIGSNVYSALTSSALAAGINPLDASTNLLSISSVEVSSSDASASSNVFTTLASAVPAETTPIVPIAGKERVGADNNDSELNVAFLSPPPKLKQVSARDKILDAAMRGDGHLRRDYERSEFPKLLWELFNWSHLQDPPLG
ncbi:hypothetical protein B0H13DRAFT_2337282 [Mycena leptocephala]|nr:hypothetical protein B0H13DRAFT_2337282 [Mycena leptocephala]